MEHKYISPDSLVTLAPPAPPDDRREAIAYHINALEELADSPTGGGGWTAFSRKLFLDVLAETGRVTTACQYCGLSKQAAYALRSRDAVFAAGWDAACELARAPLADALYEQAMGGLTETITRGDGQTITRHRFDCRLSIAVLHRLDRRCDRAADRGSLHLGAVRQWGDFIGAIGSDDHDRAQAILGVAETPRHSQPSQAEAFAFSVSDRVWWDEDEEEWRTDFVAPAGFDGDEAEDESSYHRALTAEESILVQRHYAARDLVDQLEEAAQRDAFFAVLRAANPDEPPDPPDSGVDADADVAAADDEQPVDPPQPPDGDSGDGAAGPTPAPPLPSARKSAKTPANAGQPGAALDPG